MSAANRSKFFCENNEWISDPPSRESDDISLASRTFPLASTASCGGLAKGSTGTSLFSVASSANFSSSLALYSGHHNLKDSLWMIAGNSSIIKVRNCISIVFCK